MRQINRWNRPAFAASIVLALALLLGACSDSGAGEDDVASLDEGTTDDSTGGGGDGEDLSDEETEEALLDWTECMREQGVDIPDPEVNEDGGIVFGGSGLGGPGGGDEEDDGDDDGADELPFDREAMEEATEECGNPPVGGGQELSEEELQERQDEALAFSECMRENGIEDFPDPDFSQEGPGGPVTNSSGDDEDDDTEGDDDDEAPSGPRIAGPWGELDLSDPENEAAFEACQEELGDFGPGGGPGGADERSAESEGDS